MEIDKITWQETRLTWIDFLKGLAILAVIIDHCYGLLYTSRTIHYHTIFSVTLFIFIGGIASAISFQNANDHFLENIRRRIKTIVFPYLLGTLCWSLANDGGILNLTNYFSLVFQFKATAAYYFICIYIQLIIVSPVIYVIFYKNDKVILHFCLLAASALLSILFMNHTYVLPLWGGGKYLLGGSYLFVFTLGMFFYRYKVKVNCIRSGLIYVIITSIVLLYISHFELLPKGAVNPPNIYTIFYTLCIFLVVYFSYYTWTLKNVHIFPIVGRFIRMINFLGRNSLFVFLFHNLFISIAIKYNIVSYFYGHYSLSISQNIFNIIWVLFMAIFPAFIIKKYIYVKIYGIVGNIYSK